MAVQERNTFQIGELATRSGLTPDALRYYERLGLLPPPQRTSGGFRVYTPAALDRLRFIKQAQTLGLSLQEIRTLVSYADRGGVKRCQRVRDLLQRKIADLDTRLAELQEFRCTLQGYFEECERTLAKGDREECPVIEHLEVKS
jgi:DNA-binding transcriptional MerR regulator